MTIRILNITILVVAIVLSAFLVRRFFFQSAQNPDYRLATDASLSINGINWADSERTVLIALGKECKYCTQSAQFYRRLAAGSWRRCPAETRITWIFQVRTLPNTENLTRNVPRVLLILTVALHNEMSALLIRKRPGAFP